VELTAQVGDTVLQLRASQLQIVVLTLDLLDFKRRHDRLTH
jgi:hypothetical protein